MEGKGSYNCQVFVMQQLFMLCRAFRDPQRPLQGLPIGQSKLRHTCTASFVICRMNTLIQVTVMHVYKTCILSVLFRTSVFTSCRETVGNSLGRGCVQDAADLNCLALSKPEGHRAICKAWPVRSESGSAPPSHEHGNAAKQQLRWYK